jgi:hypothetical protein
VAASLATAENNSKKHITNRQPPKFVARRWTLLTNSFFIANSLLYSVINAFAA